MIWLDAAPTGSSSCIVNAAFHFFFYFKFNFTKFIMLGSNPDPD
jgi:hypothetical protein